mmetsp:Transcript_84176/g.148800  ORF Transcript_84176/g.148800 Transcript_84176/m.148800 type:complete len:208 (+) Transcript_84176:473-1096(+)
MTTQELEGQNSQGPPVHCNGVTSRGNELRGKVVGSATRCVSFTNHHLGQAHVCQLDISIFVEQQILRFQVTEDDLFAVQVLESENDTSCVELCMGFLAEEALLVVRSIKLSTQGQLQEEVKCLGSVISLIELDNERRITHDLNVLLTHHTRLHARLHHIPLAKSLQSIGVRSVSLLHQLHSSKTTTAQKAELLQILPFDVAKSFRLA